MPVHLWAVTLCMCGFPGLEFDGLRCERVLMQQDDDGNLSANPGPTPSRNSSSEPPPAWAWSEDEQRGPVIMSVSMAVVW